MATLHIAEYSDIGSTARGSIPIPLEPVRAEQFVEVTAQSAQSDTFSTDTCIVTLISDADCVIAIGVDPDATNSVRLLPAGVEKIITVAQGSNLRVAVAGKGSGAMHDNLGAFLSVVANPADAKKNMEGLKAQADVADKSAAALRAASDVHKKTKADAEAATVDAKKAHDAAVASAVALDAERNRLEQEKKTHAARLESDARVAEAQTATIAEKQAAVDAASAALEGRASELDDAAHKLQDRETVVANRERAVADAKADYEARIAKLKALTA